MCSLRGGGGRVSILDKKHEEGRAAFFSGKAQLFAGPPKVWYRQIIVGVEFRPESFRSVQKDLLEPIESTEVDYNAGYFLYGREAPLHVSTVVLEASEEGFDQSKWEGFCCKLEIDPMLSDCLADARSSMRLGFERLVVTPDSILAATELQPSILAKFRKTSGDLIAAVGFRLGVEFAFRNPPWSHHMSLARPTCLPISVQPALLQSFEALKEKFEKGGGIVMVPHNMFVRPCVKYLLGS